MPPLRPTHNQTASPFLRGWLSPIQEVLHLITLKVQLSKSFTCLSLACSSSAYIEKPHPRDCSEASQSVTTNPSPSLTGAGYHQLSRVQMTCMPSVREGRVYPSHAGLHMLTYLRLNSVVKPFNHPIWLGVQWCNPDFTIPKSRHISVKTADLKFQPWSE